jgi:hypothetical protein
LSKSIVVRFNRFVSLSLLPLYFPYQKSLAEILEHLYQSNSTYW